MPIDPITLGALKPVRGTSAPAIAGARDTCPGARDPEPRTVEGNSTQDLCGQGAIRENTLATGSASTQNGKASPNPDSLLLVSSLGDHMPEVPIKM